MRQAATKIEAFFVGDNAREHAHDHPLRVFGRMASHAKIESLVDPAIDVGKLDLETVEGRGQAHSGYR